MQRWIINKQFWWLGILEVPTPPPTLTTNTIRSTPPPDYKVVYILDRAYIHHRCRSKHSTPGPFHSFHWLGSPSSLPIALLSLFKDPHIHLSFISSRCRHAIMTELMWQNTWLVKYPPSVPAAILDDVFSFGFGFRRCHQLHSNDRSLLFQNSIHHNF